MLHSTSSLAKAAGIPEITIQYMNTDEAQDRMRVAANSIASHIERLLKLSDTETKAIVEPALTPELEEALKEVGEVYA